MGEALIIGAGAIGRGYVPWELQKFNITFFDSSEDLVDRLSSAGTYKSFMSFGDRLDVLNIDSTQTFSSLDNIDLRKFDIAIVCVGPRNLKHLPKQLGDLTCPLYSLENDSATVSELRKLLSKNNIYFGVPDVITSLTASPENLKMDKNSIHTENGVLYLEDHGDISQGLKELMPKVEWISIDRMKKEWDAKLFIHNTPHCIAAFYGYRHGCEYVHEALALENIAIELTGVVDEVLQTLKVHTDHDHEFLEWYARKEISRFSNKLLFDPVKRVAREPLRKLAPDGRLIGILRMALDAGVMPVHLAKGVAVALKYDMQSDQDSVVIRNLAYLGLPAFLRYILNVDPKSTEGKLIMAAYEHV